MAKKVPRTRRTRQHPRETASPALTELLRLGADGAGGGVMVEGWAPELGRVDQSETGSLAIAFDLDRLDASSAVAVRALRESPDSAEALVIALAVRLEMARQCLEIQRRWRVERAAKGAAGRAEQRHPRSDEIVPLIRRGLSDRSVASHLGVDREAVARERRAEGLSPRQVRAIRDDWG